MGWNAAGGALGNWIGNKDPLSGAISNGISYKNNFCLTIFQIRKKTTVYKK